jgi:acetyltransferase-like isoleucine patch superfamily enzyme
MKSLGIKKIKLIVSELIRRFLQWLVGGGIFDFPPLAQLRNIIYHSIFRSGHNLSIGQRCRFIRADGISSPLAEGKLHIGNNVAINHHVEIDYSGGVTMEDDVWISQNVLIETHTHILDKKLKSQWLIKRSPLIIRRDAWIGAKAIIMDSVKEIGEGAIVAAGAIVTKNVPDWTIVGNSPAQEIKKRT